MPEQRRRLPDDDAVLNEEAGNSRDVRLLPEELDVPLEGGRTDVQPRALLPGGRFEDVPDHPGLRNVVGTVPGTKPAIVIGAHYDTLVEPEGFVGELRAYQPGSPEPRWRTDLPGISVDLLAAAPA